MKSSIIKIFLTSAAVFGLAAGVSAQNTYSGYFLEDYTVRHEMNPAFGGTSKYYVGMPVLSNINLAMRGTLHVSDILYPNPVPGGKKTVLFTNPEISVSEAMGKFSKKNQVGANIKLDILNVGFTALGGYNTVGLNVVSNVNVGVPKAFFSLLKEGVSNQSYDIQHMRVSANAYAELALNHSRDLPMVPGLRVGAAVKFLFGVANVDAYFNKANLTLGENDWTAVTNANVYASCKGLSYKTDFNENTNHEYVSGIDMGTPGLNGFGLGFDLGAVYKWKDFTFSAALLDLGFLSYGNTMYATTNGDKTFNTNAYTFSINDDGEDKAWDNMKDGLAALYELDNKGNIGSRTRALKATLNLAAEYEFPYYKPLHFGFLSSTYFNGPFTWSQVRLSANVKPCKVVSASANLALGTYGVGFGWLLNINTIKGLNFFIGMDHTLGKLAKQGLPLNSNAEVNLGFNFPF